MKNKKFGFTAALSIVIANMIGTGVFTSLGFQLLDLNHIYSIVLLWLTGGFIAIMGSFCYAELSSAFPRSGGEYHFLRLSFNDAIGFLSGWTSAFLGFAAPIAAAAFAFSKYFGQVIPMHMNPLLLSVAVVIMVTLIQMMNMKIGERFQVLFTIGKVMLMLVFIFAGLFFRTDSSNFNQEMFKGDYWSDVTLPAFWIALIYVSYSYSGWNASAYIIEDIDKPQKNVPRSILWGTLIVMVIYVLINYVFMISAPADQMRGKEEVAHVAASYLFGINGARVASAMISFFLVSSISSMVIVGPRVIKRISDDYSGFSFFAKSNNNHIPVRAILLQSAIAIVLLMTSSFSFIITSIGFLLTIFTTLTAAGLIVLRVKRPDAERRIKVPFYPVFPLLFIIFNLFTLYYVIINKPVVVISGMLFLCAGLIVYLLFRNKK